MTPGVSVIICCHNSVQRLPETLRHLAAQKVPATIPWEIIVVDNGSTDDTSQIALSCWLASLSGSLSVISEPVLGLNSARKRGIISARYDIISLIDDDNWVAPDWISRVHAIFHIHPEVGACGGKSESAPEIALPPWFEQVQGYYAVGSQYSRGGDITEAHGTLLWGAGLSFRTLAFRQLLENKFEFSIQDRKGKELSTGGDTEICFAIRALGWRLWYDDKLVLRHFITKDRLTWGYAKRLMYGMGRAAAFFDLYLVALRRAPFDSYPAWKRTWLFQFPKTIRLVGTAILAHPLACLRRPEGLPEALQFEILRGKLASLWSLRLRYRTLSAKVTQAKWADSKNLSTATRHGEPTP